MNGEIDFLRLTRILWRKRRIIVISSILFAVLGAVFALFAPNTFRATTLFVPQSGTEKSGLSGLGGLASLAGVNLNSVGSESQGLPPALYPEVIRSTSFKAELLDSKISFQDKELTVREYLLSEKTGFGLAVVKKYTLGLPALVVKLLKGKSSESSRVVSVDSELMSISDQEFELYTRIDGQLGIAVSDKTGFVELSFLAQDPIISALITEIVTNLLQEFIVEYKVQNTRALMAFTVEQYKLKRKDFIAKQDNLAGFKDNNRDISNNMFQNQLMRLQADYDLAQNIFNELATQKEKISLQLEKDTPLFLIVQPVVIPNLRHAPKRAQIVMIYGIIGVLLSAMFIIVRPLVLSIITSVLDKKVDDSSAS